MKRQALIMVLGLGLAACGGGGGGEAGGGNAASANQQAAPAPAADANLSAAVGSAGGGGAATPCPFKETSDWHGSLEGGRLVVNGEVDLLMAGFKAGLTKRPSAAPGVLALDMAMVPEPGGEVHKRAKYEERGAGPYNRAEIYCGGARIAEVNITNIG